MPRQEVNIGVEGNDGTGDSIRASFNKVNENFIELYAVFGIEGQIKFTNLSDTPNTLTANTIPLVNSAGTAVDLVQLASNSAIDSTAQDSIQFSYNTAGKLVLTSGFGQVADDLSPTLGGPLNAGGHAIANVAISSAAASALAAQHSSLTSVTEDDLVITKRYADQRYITAAVPVTVDDQASGTAHYSWQINSYVSGAVEIVQYYKADQTLATDAQGNVLSEHGLDSSSNGVAVKFKAISTDPNALVTDTIYYLRVITKSRLWLFSEANKAYATAVSDSDAEQYRQQVSGTIQAGDTHTITLASFDSSLSGTYLADQALPRKEVVMRSGDTMTGALFLNDHPGDFANLPRSSDTEDYRAATKFYVDNSGYSSPEVLFVSTRGDDFMRNAPVGKEGTSRSYAFKTINAAARRADDLIRTAPISVGPYAQDLTVGTGTNTRPVKVMLGRVKDAVFNNARNLLQKNSEFIQKEVTSYINKTYPNYSYNEERCRLDLSLIIDSIAFDVNKGQNTNSLTRIAAERYYSSVSGRRAITDQLVYTRAAFAFAKTLSSVVLQNNLYLPRVITGISKTNAAGANITVVTTSANHGYQNGDIVFIKDVAGMTEINGKTAYVKTLDSAPTQFELYENSNLTIGFNSSSFTTYTSGGNVGIRFQRNEQQYFESAEINITAATASLPVLVTTDGFHFLDDNESIEIINASGMSDINLNTLKARRVNDTQIQLYTNTFDVKLISAITIGSDVEITTSTNHGLSDGDLVTFTGIQGTVQLNNAGPFYVDVTTTTKFKLYTNSGLTTAVTSAYGNGLATYTQGGTVTKNALDGSSFSAYTGNGKIIKATDASSAAITDVEAKWNLIDDIITQGIDAGSAVVTGNTYEILVENGNTAGGNVNQTDPENADAIAGKVVRGKTSGALGLIVDVTNNSTADSAAYNGVTQTGPTKFTVNLLEAKDFETDEDIEFGNKSIKKQCVIEVEAGHYEEDYPIKITKNVSLKGDEFRRVVISPATEKGKSKGRVSQSKWARTYFYRDDTFDGLSINNGGTEFKNQSNEAQGKFGYHYQVDPAAIANVDNNVTIVNAGQYETAYDIIIANNDYIVEETVEYFSKYNQNTTISYPTADIRKDYKSIVEAVANDLRIGGETNTLEIQGSFHGTALNGPTKTASVAALTNVKTIITSLLSGTAPTHTVTMGSYTYTAGSTAVVAIEAPILLKNASNVVITDTARATLAGQLVDKIAFAFNAAYAPPLRNDEIDVFLMDDTTVIRNVTCKGHGGFMGVLDPDGSILTKSPYIQNATSFSKSLGNRKNFAGGMYIDAYTGNLPVKIETYDATSLRTGTNKEGNAATGYLRVNVISDNGQGLYRRAPQLPCPFFIEGRRYTVVAITQYDQSLGKAILHLDPTSDGDNGYDPARLADSAKGATDAANPRSIFLQTAGNRSMLANGFTQVNDLGYGTVAANGGLSEQVSQFSYYTHAAMYAVNGSEIRALNCSSGYGNFGLVAEGADPNEIPDQVILRDNMVMPLQVFAATVNSIAYTANQGDTNIVVYGAVRAPLPQSIITVNHGGSTGRLNYKISTVTDIASVDGAASVGPGTAPYNKLYRLSLQVDNVVTDDFFGTIQAAITNADFIEYRDNFQVIYDSVRSPSTLKTRPSTAINFDESDDVTYRTLDFSVQDPFGGALLADEIRTTHEVGYDHIELEANFVNAFPADANAGGKDYLLALNVSPSGTYPNTLRLVPTTVLSGLTITGTVPANATITQGSVTGLVRKQVESGATSLSLYNVTGGSFTHTTAVSGTNVSGTPSNPVKEIDGMKFAWEGRTHQVTKIRGPIVILTLPTPPGSTVAVDTVVQQGSTTAKVAIEAASSATVLYVYDVVNGPFTTSSNITITGATGSTPSNIDASATHSAIYVIKDGTDLGSPTGATGLSEGVTSGTKLFAGLAGGNNTNKNATAEITVKISITRASNHDFTQIGTGGFNDSNYPSNIFGDPERSLATSYTDTNTATSSQVWERRKGRVFFVSTDQFGFFRVGKFFNVDQGTGKITFAGDLGISNADALGFKKGVTIDEFSPDESMTDESGTAVPTEKAITTYITKVLGINPKTGAIVPSGTKIGPGFLALDGSTTMTGDLNVGTKKITNLANPVNLTDAVNKQTLDSKTGGYSGVGDSRDWGYNLNAGTRVQPGANQIIVSSGNKIIFTQLENSGTFTAGDTIGNSSPVNSATAQGTIVQIETVNDPSYGGNVRKIVYTPTVGSFDTANDTTIHSSLANATTINPGGPYSEITYAAKDTASDINITVSRTSATTTIDLQYAAGSIVNADVASNAAIQQSKLALANAGTAANSGAASSVLGVAAFDENVFTASNGFIGLKTATTTTDGIAVDKLSQIATGKVLGNNSGSTGAVELIDITALGLSISDFGSYTSGEYALIRTGATTVSQVQLEDGTGSTLNSTVPKRTSTGQLRASGFVLGGDATYEVISGSSTSLIMKTPGQRIIFTASGGNASVATPNFNDNLSIGSAGSGNGGTQANADAAYSTNGALHSKWVFTKAIEAVDNSNGKTGIVFGSDGNTGTPLGENDTLTFFNNGIQNYRLSSASFSPVTTDVKDIGTTTKKWQNAHFSGTIYASVFDGTATSARYADLAENYLADAQYDIGTVLVFGGENEITVTNKMNDKRIAGIVSEKPAYLMNSELTGEFVTPIALQGRVKCKVIGKIIKGDMLVSSSIKGYAMAADDPKMGTVIGKAIENKNDTGKGFIEIVVGRV